jgi:hypothetical protein
MRARVALNVGSFLAASAASRSTIGWMLPSALSTVSIRTPCCSRSPLAMRPIRLSTVPRAVR